jgi:hypothetical protein
MTKSENSKNLETVEPEASCSASEIPASPSSDAPSISGQPDAVENTQPQDTPDGGSPHKMNEESTGPCKVPRSTGRARFKVKDGRLGMHQNIRSWWVESFQRKRTRRTVFGKNW